MLRQPGVARHVGCVGAVELALKQQVELAGHYEQYSETDISQA